MVNQHLPEMNYLVHLKLFLIGILLIGLTPLPVSANSFPEVAQTPSDRQNSPSFRVPDPDPPPPEQPNLDRPTELDLEVLEGEESTVDEPNETTNIPPRDRTRECKIETAAQRQVLLEAVPIPREDDNPPESIPNTQNLRFEFIGNHVFSDRQLLEFLEHPEEAEEAIDLNHLTFPDIVKAAAIITEKYNDEGYINSFATAPPQTVENGNIKIIIVEGGLDSIRLIRESDRDRLQDQYICDRLALAAKPLNLTQLLDALRQLQLDPLIADISAELILGTQIESHILEVRLKEAKTLTLGASLDNGRPPSIGTFRRRGQIAEGNLLGFGDRLSLGYSNTDGSNAFDASYTIPLNPRDGTLTFAVGDSSSGVIEPPFKTINLRGDSRYFDLILRQPLYQRAGEELTVSINASHRHSQTSILGFNFPLSEGADAEGNTRISALRFGVEWQKLSNVEVFFVRGQLNLGLDFLDSTINEISPDSRFLSGQIQGLWLRRLAPDTQLLLRGNLQFADRPLLGQEQFAIGGLGSVRGYRQDLFSGDNGAFATVELQYPILGRSGHDWGVLQVTPFLDFGTVWSASERGDSFSQTLFSIGAGLRWEFNRNSSVTIYWGLPLIETDSRDRTWQENGFLFLIRTGVTF